MTPTIWLRFAAPQEIVPDRKMASRFLGYRGALPEDAAALFDFAEAQLRLAVTYKACSTVLPVTVRGAVVDFAAFQVQSAQLAKNLAGCSEAVLFAATLGVGVDRTILKYSKTAPSKGAVLDALASAAIEGWCDRLNRDYTAGRDSSPRFSPGYGDLSIQTQRDVFRVLDVPRKIGVTLSETCFMTPTKSVTAFIGLKGEGTI